MNKVTDFFKNAVSSIFGRDEEPKEDVKTYNETQVKAGIVHLRNILALTDENADKDDYSFAFQNIHLKPKMDANDIKEQMHIVLDALYDRDLITPKEKGKVNRDTLLASMTKTVTDGIEKGDFNEMLLNSIRFDQELRKPQLQVIDFNSPENN